MINVAALYRLSSAKQVKSQKTDDVDIPGQRAAIRRFVAEHPDWILRPEHEYEEPGVSAWKKRLTERPVVQTLLADAAARRWSVLLVFKEDRLARDGMELVYVVRTMENCGVALWSVSDRQSLSTQDEQFLMTAFKGYSAEKESRKTSDRVKNAMRNLVEDGRWHGGKVPFGYSLRPQVDVNGQMILRGNKLVQELYPNEWADTVREVFARFLNGEGLVKIATWLNQTDVPTRTGTTWSREAVGYMLDNPFYCGWISYGHRPQKGQPKGEPMLVQGKHPAVIDKETWDQVQTVRRHRNSIPKRQQSATYALTGVLRCRECGALMGGTTRRFPLANGSMAEYQEYRCTARADRGICSTGYLSASVVEGLFLDGLVEQFSTPTGLRTFLEQQDQQATERAAQAERERKAAAKRLATVEAALKRLDKAFFESGVITDQEYKEKKAAYQQEKAELDQLTTAAPQVTGARNYDLLAMAAADLRANWNSPHMTPDKKKEVAREIVLNWSLAVTAKKDKSTKTITVEIAPQG